MDCLEDEQGVYLSFRNVTIAVALTRHREEMYKTVRFCVVLAGSGWRLLRFHSPFRENEGMSPQSFKTMHPDTDIEYHQAYKEASERAFLNVAYCLTHIYSLYRYRNGGMSRCSLDL